MKFEALKWLRLDQRCMFIATEVGAYSSDVMGINEKKIIEIEVKTTFQDFKNDFRKHKHSVYLGRYGTEWEQQWIPTHFYFAVTDEIADKVLEFLKEDKTEMSKNYGVIKMSDWRVIKRAKWLHERPPNNRVKCTLALRMGSELIRFHEAWL
jgi:hypothetical protein